MEKEQEHYKDLLGDEYHNYHLVVSQQNGDPVDTDLIDKRLKKMCKELSMRVFGRFSMLFSTIFNIAKWAGIAILPRGYRAFADRLSSIFRRSFDRLSSRLSGVFLGVFQNVSHILWKKNAKRINFRTDFPDFLETY